MLFWISVHEYPVVVLNSHEWSGNEHRNEKKRWTGSVDVVVIGAGVVVAIVAVRKFKGRNLM